MRSSKYDIKVCNEKEIVQIIKESLEKNQEKELELIDFSSEKFELLGVKSTNVSIKKIIIKNKNHRFKPYSVQ